MENLSELIVDLIDAKQELESFEPSEYTSIDDNNKRRKILSDNFVEAKAAIDDFINQINAK